TGSRREGGDQRLAQAAPFVTHPEERLHFSGHRLWAADCDENAAQECAGPHLQSEVAYGPGYLDRLSDLPLGDRHLASRRGHPGHSTVVPTPLELVSPAIADGECFLEERCGETVVTLGQVGVADELQRVGQTPLILGGASQLRGLDEVLPCQDWVGRVQAGSHSVQA